MTATPTCAAGWIVQSGDLMCVSERATITDAFRDALDRQTPTELGALVEFTPRDSGASGDDVVYVLTERLLKRLGRWED